MKNNVQVELLVACELAQVTQDGKLSLMGIFSRLVSGKMPFRIPRFFVVAMLEGSPLSESSVSFQIIGPSARDVIQEYQANVQLGFDGKANVINELTNTNLNEYGEYLVLLNVNGEIKGQKKFTINEPLKHSINRGVNKVAN